MKLNRIVVVAVMMVSAAVAVGCKRSGDPGAQPDDPPNNPAQPGAQGPGAQGPSDAPPAADRGDEPGRRRWARKHRGPRQDGPGGEGRPRRRWRDRGQPGADQPQQAPPQSQPETL